MSPRRRLSPLIAPLGLAVTATLLLSGCGADDDGSTPSASHSGCATENTSGRKDINLIPVPPAKVTVTSAGTGTRRAPIAAADMASAQDATIVTSSSVASRDATDAQTVELPVTARFHCSDPTDLEMDLRTVTSPDPALNSQLTSVAGSHAGMAIAPGQVPISLRLIPADAAGPEARLAVEQSLIGAFTRSIPLPSEPIAVGAAWRAERIITGAATVTQTINAQLTAWDGNRLTIKFSTDETPVNSVFAIPGGNQTLTIGRYSFAGTGTMTVDLTRGLPVAGEARYAGARELIGTDPAQPLLQQTGFTVSYRSR